MNQAQKIPYVIEGTIPDRYPRGWFCVGTSYEFTDQPRMMNYFGTSIVGYRGEDGEVHALDAYWQFRGLPISRLELGCRRDLQQHSLC
jgi:3-ketosteroid 9alpha-monooxygenase subunit A